MANLTDIAYLTRKAVRYSWVGLIAFIVLRLGIMYSIALFKYLNPPPPPAPTCGWGSQPDLTFPQKGGYSYEFVFESPNGKFPLFPTQAPVYYMPYQRASFSAFDQATSLANSLGFRAEPKKLSKEEYEWSIELPSPLTLKVNITNGSYTMNYQWQTDPSLLTDKQLFGKDQTIQNSRRYMDLTTNTDINVSEPVITYYKASGNTMTPAQSLSEADFIKADYFRNDIDPPKTLADNTSIGKDKVQVVTPKPGEGIVTIIFSGAKETEKKVVSLNYVYFPVNYNYYETYPLKSVNTAWEELVQGQGYIARIDNNPKSVTVRRVNLAYYDAKEPQKLLQPVYVFSSPDDNFVAYVPALAPCTSQKTRQ